MCVRKTRSLGVFSAHQYRYIIIVTINNYSSGTVQKVSYKLISWKWFWRGTLVLKWKEARPNPVAYVWFFWIRKKSYFFSPKVPTQNNKTYKKLRVKILSEILNIVYMHIRKYEIVSGMGRDHGAVPLTEPDWNNTQDTSRNIWRMTALPGCWMRSVWVGRGGPLSGWGPCWCPQSAWICWKSCWLPSRRFRLHLWKERASTYGGHKGIL